LASDPAGSDLGRRQKTRQKTCVIGTTRAMQAIFDRIKSMFICRENILTFEIELGWLRSNSSFAGLSGPGAGEGAGQDRRRRNSPYQLVLGRQPHGPTRGDRPFGSLVKAQGCFVGSGE